MKPSAVSRQPSATSPSLRGALRRGNLGFSLAEVMVAVVILSVSLLTIYGIYIKAFTASSRGELKSVANSIAQEAIEDIANEPFNEIVLNSSTIPSGVDPVTFTNTDGTSVTENIVSTNTGFDYQVTEERLGVDFIVETLITWHDDAGDTTGTSDPDPNDYKRIQVSVTWPIDSSHNNSIVLDRFVSMFFRPRASSAVSADAGRVNLTDNSNFARLGSVNVTNFTGGSRTARAESEGFAGGGFTSGQIATVESFTDDDVNTASVSEENHLEGEVNDIDVDTNDDFGVLPIIMKDEARSIAQASSSASRNIIGLVGQGWHDDEFAIEGIWQNWPAPPNWPNPSTSWVAQPSAIGKSTLTQGMRWNYTPDQGSIGFFETGSVLAGAKSVVTAAVSNNKIAARSWAEVRNVRILETSALPDGLINIERLAVRFESEANAVGGGARVNIQEVNFNDFRVWNPTTGIYKTIASQADIDFALPPQIQSITIGSPVVDTSANGTQAQASVTALAIVTNASNNVLVPGVNIPAATITLGIAEANVSYTSN